MIERLFLRTGVRVAQRPQFVFHILKNIRVDGANCHPLRFGVLAHSRVIAIFGLVPRNVDRHRGGNAGHFVDGGGVVHLLARRRGGAGPGERLEAGAAIRIAPTGCFDLLRFERAFHRFNVNAIGGQGLGQHFVCFGCCCHSLACFLIIGVEARIQIAQMCYEADPHNLNPRLYGVFVTMVSNCTITDHFLCSKRQQLSIKDCADYADFS